MDRRLLILIVVVALVLVAAVVGSALVGNAPRPTNSPLTTGTPSPTPSPISTSTASPTNNNPSPTGNTASPSSSPFLTPTPMGTAGPSSSPSVSPIVTPSIVPTPTISPGNVTNSTQITVNRGSMMQYDFNGTTYFFYYPVVNSVLVESGGLYQNFTAVVGNTYTVFNLQVVVSEVYADRVVLLVKPSQ